MQSCTVVFAHGQESGPWGTKIRTLAKVAETLGCRVVSRDDSDCRDPELRVARLIDAARSIKGPLVLAGSSMGGYVAAVAAQELHPSGLFLMAPAFGLPGYAVRMPSPACRQVTVVHGWHDEVVPLDAVLEFARKQRAMLHVIPAGHRLLEQVAWLEQVFKLFLDHCLTPGCVTARERLLASI
jgi:predicted alpha/beta-hydrolase family hydrolase